jgi:serralysin
VDPSNVIAETDEFNNAQAASSPLSIAAPATIDLDPYYLSCPSSAQRGSTVSVFTDIDNKGTSPSGSFTVRYYLSPNTFITTSDILLKTVTRSSIAGGSYQQWYESIVLPSWLTPGTYYVGVMVDPFNAIAETDESNNAQAAGSSITITA